MPISNLNIYKTPEELTKIFAEVLKNKFDELLKNNQNISIAISGGNTPKALFEILASEYKYSINWNQINFYWVDERCAEPDDEQSNFGNAYNLLFSKIDISPSAINRIKGEASAKAEAKRYSELVKMKVKQKNSLPCFDIILLGMGNDGHTASIFPNQMKLLESPEIYTVSTAPKGGLKRITMTGKIINNSDTVYFLVSGSDKASVFNTIQNNEADANKYPAAYIKPEGGELYWYVDSKAAGG